MSTGEELTSKGGINGFHINGCAHDTESVDSLSEGLDALLVDARELEDCDPAVPRRAGQSPWSGAGGGQQGLGRQQSCPLPCPATGSAPHAHRRLCGMEQLTPPFLLFPCLSGQRRSASAVLSPLPVKPVCFSTAVPELANGIADFDTQSLTLHPSQSSPSLRQRPEQRSTSRSQSRLVVSGSTPAALPAARLDDLPVSPTNKKLGKAQG